MQLPGRMAAAIEVLEDVFIRHRPVAIALKDWGTGHRFAGSGDRAAIGNLVYDALRRRASHGFAMGSDSPRALILSVAVRDWAMPAPELAALFDGDRFAPDPLTDDEIARLEAANPLDGAPDSVRADLPGWLLPSLQGAFDDNWLVEAQGLTGRPALDMRVNTLKADAARVLKALDRFGPEDIADVPNAIRLPAGTGSARTPNVQADAAFRKGWCEIQDLGSQIVSLITDARPGQQVLDMCAGGGGKTLAMAAAMNSKGQIFAYDADRSRLAPIHERLKRNGARNVQVLEPVPGALADLTGRMDRVLIDAPCSGTGTWRRRPDTKWRLSADQLAARQAEQAEILATAHPFVKPGGRLIYITCSLLPEENETQIERFLQENAHFEPIDPATLGAQVLPDMPAGRTIPTARGLMLTPATSGSDGFYVAVLSRRG